MGNIAMVFSVVSLIATTGWVFTGQVVWLGVAAIAVLNAIAWRGGK